MKKILIILSALITTPSFADDSSIRIVGSSTVFPFTAAVAEKFGKTSNFKTPIVESTGTGGGFKLFCSGPGTSFPDATNASRKITNSEINLCKTNGVEQIIEFKIGYDGIVVADKNSSPNKFNLTSENIWKALAKQVPVNGNFVNNPYKTWKDIDSSFPNVKIEILGPPPTSGTRDSFVELILTKGCLSFPEIINLSSSDKKKYCETLREDGAFIEAGENDNLIVQKLVSSPNSLGVFGFSFYDQNRDKLKAHTVDGNAPTLENISSGKYAAARDMYVYIKQSNLSFKPGLKQFVQEYARVSTLGDDGYLVDKGLIPLHKEELTKVLNDIKSSLN